MCCGVCVEVFVDVNARGGLTRDVSAHRQRLQLVIFLRREDLEPSA